MCVQEPCVYLLSAASVVIRNMYVLTYCSGLLQETVNVCNSPLFEYVKKMFLKERSFSSEIVLNSVTCTQGDAGHAGVQYQHQVRRRVLDSGTAHHKEHNMAAVSLTPVILSC